MEIPREDRSECLKCGGQVIRGRTTRKSKGEFAVVTLDADEDTDGSQPNLQWALSLVGNTYHAGQPVTKNQRAGMVAAGITFHLEHAKTCATRFAKGKRPGSERRQWR